MKTQNNSAMGIIMNNTVPNGSESTTSKSIKIDTKPANVQDIRDIAAKFVYDNMDTLQRLIEKEKKDAELNDKSGESDPDDVLDENEKLVLDFLGRHNLPSCCRFFYWVNGFNVSKPLYVFCNDVQLTFLSCYFKEVNGKFNQYWKDGEEGLLSAIFKTRKLLRDLDKIQYLYPSSDTFDKPICENGNKKLYYYIGLGLSVDMMSLRYEWTNDKYLDERNEPYEVGHLTKTLTTKKTLDELDKKIDDGTIYALGFMDFVRYLADDMVDFIDIDKHMSFWDMVTQRGSYKLMQFFLKTYSDTLEQFEQKSQPETEETDTTPN